MRSAAVPTTHMMTPLIRSVVRASACPMYSPTLAYPASIPAFRADFAQVNLSCKIARRVLISARVRATDCAAVKDHQHVQLAQWAPANPVCLVQTPVKRLGDDFGLGPDGRRRRPVCWATAEPSARRHLVDSGRTALVRLDSPVDARQSRQRGIDGNEDLAVTPLAPARHWGPAAGAGRRRAGRAGPAGRGDVCARPAAQSARGESPGSRSCGFFVPAGEGPRSSGRPLRCARWPDPGGRQRRLQLVRRAEVTTGRRLSDPREQVGGRSVHASTVPPLPAATASRVPVVMKAAATGPGSPGAERAPWAGAPDIASSLPP